MSTTLPYHADKEIKCKMYFIGFFFLLEMNMGKGMKEQCKT